MILKRNAIRWGKRDSDPHTNTNHYKRLLQKEEFRSTYLLSRWKQCSHSERLQFVSFHTISTNFTCFLSATFVSTVDRALDRIKKKGKLINCLATIDLHNKPNNSRVYKSKHRIYINTELKSRTPLSQCRDNRISYASLHQIQYNKAIILAPRSTPMKTVYCFISFFLFHFRSFFFLLISKRIEKDKRNAFKL